MSDDPLQKMLAALIRQGATEADLDAYTHEYEHQHRFADPTVAAQTSEGESILPGPRTEERSYGGDVLHRIGQTASGALKALPYIATAPAEGAAFLYEMAKAGGAGLPTKDPLTALRSGMQNNPVRKAAEGVNDAVAGVADRMFGAPEDTRDKALQFGGGLVGIPAGMEAGAATLPKAGRLVGITTKAGREASAAKMLESATERSGQTGSDVAARLEGLPRPDGSTPSLAEAMGPAAEMALDRMPAVSDAAAGRASQAARAMPGESIGEAYARLAARRNAATTMPYPSAFGYVKKGLSVGLRNSARQESEEALNQLLSPAEGRLGPQPDLSAPPPPPAGPAPSTQALEGDGPSISELLAKKQANPNILPNENPKGVPSEGMIARRLAKLKADVAAERGGSESAPEIPNLTQEQYDHVTSDPDMMEKLMQAQLDLSAQRGAGSTVAGMKVHRLVNNERGSLGVPEELTFDWKPVPGKAWHVSDAKTGQPVRKFATMQEGLDWLKKIGFEAPKPPAAGERGSLGVSDAAPAPFPDRVSNTQDPYAEITKSSGPETPELARVKLLRKTLGMKGRGGLEMLLGSGAAAGGGLTLGELLSEYVQSKRTP